jgi:hypothetical protein
MIATSNHLCSRAGTSITKACARHACVMRPVSGCQQHQWNKQTGAGFTA